jgi:hypothetical protein
MERDAPQAHGACCKIASPSSQPPLLGASPLRTGRDSFPSYGSGPLNASHGSVAVGSENPENY